jgi:Cu(I)/Ag(I) efflux system membrane protein CusA/SilA
MITKLIEYSVRNRWLVILLFIGVAAWGVYAVIHTPVDAIPDLSENQVIVFTDSPGKAPAEIEEQITYPLSVQLQGLAGVKAVRSSSEFGFSMINVIFDDATDFYFARTRVLERLAVAKANLPADVTPYLAPDGTALGQIFWYTVEGGGKSLDELRAIQDFNVKYQLASIPGVAEVASVGGFVREYQVDVDPAKLRAFNLTLSQVYRAISMSNQSVGGKALIENSQEYVVRGLGWLKNVKDIENIVIASREGVPIQIHHVASVQLGPQFRRSALEKNGQEAVGGVVLMRFGGNPLAITKAIHQQIKTIEAGLPEGVKVVPFYERTRLIESAIHTVTSTLKEEMIIAIIAIILILGHFRSALVVCITLPLAVLVAFLLMYYLGIPSNIMSLSGIAISIGILVDASVVMVENATHQLKEKFGAEKVHGDTTEIVVNACRLVGRPIFFSVMIMLISFLPVFALTGQEGKLAHPLAYTKSFAMIGVAVIAVTLVPALIPLLIKGRIRREEESWIVRSFIEVYKPMLNWSLPRPGFVIWLTALIIVFAAAMVGKLQMSLALGVCAFVMLVSIRSFRWKLTAIATFFVFAFFADTRMHKLGNEFMPELNEGTIMDMPTSAPRISIGQAVDDVMVRDRIIRSFPEVESVVGKIGRAETATDPAPVDMVETVINLRPKDNWPKRKLTFEDAVHRAQQVLTIMQEKELISGATDWPAAARGVSDARFAEYHPDLAKAIDLINTVASISIERFDRSMRDFARDRNNAELHVHAVRVFDPIVIEAILQKAAGTPFSPTRQAAEKTDALLADLKGSFDPMLWHKLRGDLLKELDSELQMPGWGNAWTQPIINRVNMLATGVRTQIGIKVFGPTNKPMKEAIDEIQRVSQQIASKVKPVKGAVDVFAEQSTGKRYLEIEIDREKAARYGVNVEEVNQAIEVALGGANVTMTIEGRQRFPVRLRYQREDWQDVQAIGNILVASETSPVKLSSDAPMSSQASGEMKPLQIPLSTVADIRIVEGPAMIKSENGRLRGFVLLNVRGRDLVGFVDEAKGAIKDIESSLAGTGMSIEWAGEFENQQRLLATMKLVLPAVIAIILLLLYITLRDFADTWLVCLGVVGAMAGAVIFQAIFGFNTSALVWIGRIAAFGMATQTGVIMLVYLREAIDQAGGLKNITSLEQLRKVVINGAAHRLRPKLLTEGVAIVGLVPMLWATGTGAEIMRPMAAPVLGGLLVSDEVIDLLLPVLFYWVRKRRWKRAASM